MFIIRYMHLSRYQEIPALFSDREEAEDTRRYLQRMFGFRFEVVEVE